MEEEVAYSSEVVKSFQIAKVFDHTTKVINSLDFSDDGKLLVTACNDNNIRVYDVLEAKCEQQVCGFFFLLTLLSHLKHRTLTLFLLFLIFVVLPLP